MMVDWGQYPHPCKTCHLHPYGRQAECPKARKANRQIAKAKEAERRYYEEKSITYHVKMNGKKEQKKEKDAQRKRKGA